VRGICPAWRAPAVTGNMRPGELVKVFLEQWCVFRGFQLAEPVAHKYPGDASEQHRRW